MFRFNDYITWCLLYSLVTIGSGAEEVRPKHPYRWTNDELRHVDLEHLLSNSIKDHPGPYRPRSSEIEEVNPKLLEEINEEEYAEMSLDDPLLKYAYMRVFTESLEHSEEMTPSAAAAVADMRRRGEAVTPMLLKLLDENQETGFERALFRCVDKVGSFSIEPYIEYARRLLRERSQTMNASVAGSASELLSRYGTEDDLKLLVWVTEQRPYVANRVSSSIKVLQHRLHPQERDARPPLPRNGPSTTGTANISPTYSEPPLSEKKFDGKPLRSWLISGLFVVVLLGGTRLVLKSRSKRASGG